MKTYICPHCGSKEIVIDAVATWNEQLQQWELADFHDHADCLNCEALTSHVSKWEQEIFV